MKRWTPRFQRRKIWRRELHPISNIHVTKQREALNILKVSWAINSKTISGANSTGSKDLTPCGCHLKRDKIIEIWQQGHQHLSGKSEENKSFQPNQLAPSIYIMIALCFFSLDQWEIMIHLLWEKCFKIPHNCDPHLNQTKFNDLFPLIIAGVLVAVFAFFNRLEQEKKIRNQIWDLHWFYHQGLKDTINCQGQ